MAAMFVFYIKK